MNKKADSAAIFILLITIIFITLGFVNFFVTESTEFKSEGTMTGKATLVDARSGVDVEKIVSKKNEDNQIDTLLITVEPIKGSAPIKLSDMAIIINQENSTSILKSRNGSLTRNITDGYYTE